MATEVINVVVPGAVTTVNVATGVRGPQGVPGPQGPSSAVIPGYVAGTNLSGHRLVTLNSSQQVVYASSSNLAHVDKVIGLTVGAATAGETIEIVRSGEVNEPSWEWSLNEPIFLGVDGVLTQTPPASGFLLFVAFPISPTRVFVDIKQALIL